MFPKKVVNPKNDLDSQLQQDSQSSSTVVRIPCPVPSESEQQREEQANTSSVLISPQPVRQTHMSTFIPKKVTPRCKRTIDKQLLHLFTDTFQPFRIVEEKAFRSFEKAFCSFKPKL